MLKYFCLVVLIMSSFGWTQKPIEFQKVVTFPNDEEMIKNVRIAEKMLGDIKEKNSASELKFIKARRSIVAKRDIRKGEKLTLENITTKRPFLEGNISASEWSETLNQTASKNYKPDDFI